MTTTFRLAVTLLAGTAAWIDSLSAATIRVDPVDGDDANDGSAWIADGQGAGPRKSIHQAVADVATAGGGDVWLKKGLHQPEGVFSAGSYNGAAIVMRNGVSLLGGFDGDEADASERTLPPDPRDTIIDVSTTAAGSPAFHVLLYRQVSNAAVEGITLRGGRGTSGFADGSGCGATLDNSRVGLFFRHCHFIDNRTTHIDGHGGALQLSNSSSATFEDCLFAANAAATRVGGVLYVANSSQSLPVFRRCTFSGNMAGRGGALYPENDSGSASTTAENCVFAGNFATEYGGAVYNNGRFVATNSLFAGNRSNGVGGAVTMLRNSYAAIANCAFLENSVANTSNGILQASLFGAGNVSLWTIRNTTIAHNTGRGIYEENANSSTMRVDEISNSLFFANSNGDLRTPENTILTGAAALNARPEGTVSNTVGTAPLHADVPAGGTWTSRTVDGAYVTYTDSAATFDPATVRNLLVRPDAAQPFILPVFDATPTTITVVVAPEISTLLGETVAYSFRDYANVAGSGTQDTGADFTAGAPATARDIRGILRPRGAAFDIGPWEIPSAPFATSIVLQIVPNPAFAGQQVDLTATVTADNPSGAVEFYADDQLLGTDFMDGAGVATYSTTTLAVGTYTIKATWDGSSSSTGAISNEIELAIEPAPPGDGMVIR